MQFGDSQSNIWSIDWQAGDQGKRGRLQGEFSLPQGSHSFSFSLRPSTDCMRPTTSWRVICFSQVHWFNFFLINLLIFGCVGSSLLFAGFL